MNPELRQTLQTLSRNIESANETAQENIYTFSQNYIDPCLASVKSCFASVSEPCFHNADARKRRRRGRSHGRAEVSFDFYDDWDDEFQDDSAGEGDALLGWRNETLDRLLAGNQQPRQDGRVKDGETKQPRKQRAMSYGTRARRPGLPQDDGTDPTVIPSSSYLGFLERLPWGIGRRGLRYQPSAADLQEHPGGNWISQAEAQPLIESSDEDETMLQQKKGKASGIGRKRSGTNASHSTLNSLSSRGDLIPSGDELEADAIPLDDEFANALERRQTGTDDRSSGKTGSGKRPSASRTSTRSMSTKSAKSGGVKSQRSMARRGDRSPAISENGEYGISSVDDLKQEEAYVREEEETEVERKREAAQVLAESQGLLPAKEDGAQSGVQPVLSMSIETAEDGDAASNPASGDATTVGHDGLASVQVNDNEEHDGAG